jgi:Zn-dependent peptidase ImmA (M78 family)/transcriptional regulator with XRE-family HTH domain
MNEKEKFNLLVGSRVKLARERAGISQGELAIKMGFGKHQFISNIETGIRAVSADEIFTLIEILGVSMDFFTDPYLVVDEAVLSFRARSDVSELAAFEKRVGNLVSAAVRFSDLAGEEVNPLKQQLSVDSSTAISFATGLGTQVARKLNLGAIPAQNLEACLEKELGILVFYVDAPEGISGSACHMPRLDLIVINRSEADFRRNYDLAHELFHVLTWAKLPPRRHDWIEGKTKPKVEKLADAFASGLLMPTKSIQARWSARKESEDLNAWLFSNASEMKVSGQAFYWRLVSAGLLTAKLRAQVDESKLSRPSDVSEKPRLFCESFVRRMHTVLEQGKVSARKAAALIDLDVSELDSLFASYGLESPLLGTD